MTFGSKSEPTSIGATFGLKGVEEIVSCQPDSIGQWAILCVVEGSF